MEQNENEMNGKELFELSLSFHEGKEEGQFGVNIKAKNNGMKLVFSQITYLYVQSLHKTGKMSDEEYNELMACAGQKSQDEAESGE